MKVNFLLMILFSIMASQSMYATFGCMIQNNIPKEIRTQVKVCIPEGPCSGWAFFGGEPKMVLSLKNPNGLVIFLLYRTDDEVVTWKLTLPADVANHIDQYSIGTLHVIDVFGGITLNSHNKTYHLQAVRDFSHLVAAAAAA